MKPIYFFVLILSLSLSGCGDRIDSTNAESLAKSISEITKNLNDKDKELFVLGFESYGIDISYVNSTSHIDTEKLIKINGIYKSDIISKGKEIKSMLVDTQSVEFFADLVEDYENSNYSINSFSATNTGNLGKFSFDSNFNLIFENQDFNGFNKFLPNKPKVFEQIPEKLYFYPTYNKKSIMNNP